jgi:hypothetical protein
MEYAVQIFEFSFVSRCFKYQFAGVPAYLVVLVRLFVLVDVTIATINHNSLYQDLTSHHRHYVFASRE